MHRNSLGVDSKNGINPTKFPYLLFDLDGTVFSGDRPYPGVVSLMGSLKRSGYELMYISNNSTETSQMISEKLSGMGMPTRAEQIVVATELVGTYLKNRYSQAIVAVLGSPALAAAVEACGHTVVPLNHTAAIDALVVGRDVTFNYERLTFAGRLVRSGVEVVATNPDLYHPDPNGDRIPETGTIVAALTALSGTSAVKYLGKPDQFFFRELMLTRGLKPTDCIVIGDGAHTDIAGANALKMKSIWISHGSTFPAGLTYTPDITISEIVELEKHVLSF